METAPYLKVQALPPELLDGITITCIEAWENSIYLGTSEGEVIHFFCVEDLKVESTDNGTKITPPQYILACRQKVHATRTRPVDKILVLPRISRALVLSNSTVSVFSVPEFAPASGVGKVRDVLDMCVDQEDLGNATFTNVTTFTKNTIRIVKVTANGLKLVKDVSYAEALSGVRRGRLCLVGNAKTYDLVDVEKVRKVPLFEVWAGIDNDDVKPQPITTLVGDSEFLVACGTQKGDPAMGMIVNDDGDISRGTIAWDDFPTSVVVDYPLVGAVVGDKVCFHNVSNQLEVDMGEESGSNVTISKVLKQFEVSFPDMVEKLKPVDVCKNAEVEQSSLPNYETKSNIFTFSNSGVYAYIATPRLFHLEKLIETQQLADLSTEMESFNDKSEAAISQKKYVQLLVCLSDVIQNRQKEFKQVWTTSFHENLLEFDILMYLFVPQMMDYLEVPKGAVASLKNAQTKVGNENAEWKQTCLDICNYHLQEAQDFKGRWMLEVLLCHLSVFTDENLVQLVENKLITEKGVSTSTEILREHEKWYPLSLLELRANNIATVCEIWQSILAGDVEEPLFTDGPKRLSDLLKTCSDKEIVRAYGLWLVDKFPQEGVAIFVDNKSGSKIKFNSKEDKNKIATAIKAMKNQVAWKSYLQQMLFVEGEATMVADYVNLLVDECISDIKDCDDITESYRAITGAPKRPFFDFLKSKKGDNKSLNNRVDIIRLIDRGLCLRDTDASNVKLSAGLNLEDYLGLQEKLIKFKNHFLLELVIIYRQLGDHQRCIDSLIHDLTDFQTAIEYCAGIGKNDSDDATVAADDMVKRSLFPHLFKQLLKVPKDSDAQVYYCRQVMEKYGNYLETKFVLNSVPAHWPIEILNGYLKNVLRQLTNDKNKSLMIKSLTRSENVAMSDQLTTLTRISAEARRG